MQANSDKKQKIDRKIAARRVEPQFRVNQLVALFASEHPPVTIAFRLRRPATITLAMLLLPTTVFADDDAKAVKSRGLSVGESINVSVVAKEKFNRTGVKVAAGEHYSFVVAKDAKWKDLNIVCDANGWLSKDAPAITRNYITKAEKNRRVPAANWFELAGTVGQNEQHHFQIGLRGQDWTHSTKTDGELFLFANDLMSFYGNNHGSIEVTITRLAQPSGQKLPINPPKP